MLLRDDDVRKVEYYSIYLFPLLYFWINKLANSASS